jgi:hypothetical protein
MRKSYSVPILIRIIAQRAFVIVISALAFFGINPKIDIPTKEEAQIETERRQEIIRETIFATSPPNLNIENKVIETEDVFTIPLPNQNILEQIIIQPNPTIEIIKQEILNLPEIKMEAKEEKEKEKEKEKRDKKGETKNIRDVLLNIICTKQNGNQIDLSTGSGVLVSKKGAVLTNAHIAQYFLLKDIGYECYLKKENMPFYGYEADLVYISEEWIEENASSINNENLIRTGENDFALLLITKNIDPTFSLQSSFPWAELETDSDEITIGEKITVAGFSGSQINPFENKNIGELKTEETFIKNVFTFDKTSVDVFSTRETKVAQKGASGGGIFKNDKLIGIIVTINDGLGGEKTINGLTLDYIDKDFKDETGKPLKQYLSSDLKQLADDFQSVVAPNQAELLKQNL